MTRSPSQSTAPSVSNVASAYGVSTVATALLATRFGSSAQAAVARQAAVSPRKRRPTTNTVPSSSAYSITVGSREKKRSGRSPRTPSRRAAWRARTLGTLAGVLELKCNWEERSVSPVSRRRRA